MTWWQLVLVVILVWVVGTLVMMRIDFVMTAREQGVSQPDFDWGMSAFGSALWPVIVVCIPFVFVGMGIEKGVKAMLGRPVKVPPKKDFVEKEDDKKDWIDR